MTVASGPGVEPTPRERLRLLLTNLFTPVDLAILARDLDPEGDLHTYVPGPSAAPRDAAEGLLVGAEAKRLLGVTFFTALIQQRPRRRRDIAEVAGQWSAWQRRPLTRVWAWVAWLNRLQLGGATVGALVAALAVTAFVGSRVEAAQLDLLDLNRGDVPIVGLGVALPASLEGAVGAAWAVLSALPAALLPHGEIRYVAPATWLLGAIAGCAFIRRRASRVDLAVSALLLPITVIVYSLVNFPAAANPTEANPCVTAAGPFGDLRREACDALDDERDDLRTPLAGLCGGLVLAASAWLIRAALAPADPSRGAALAVGSLNVLVLVAAVVPTAAAYRSPGLSYAEINLTPACAAALPISTGGECHAWVVGGGVGGEAVYLSEGCAGGAARSGPRTAFPVPPACGQSGGRSVVKARRYDSNSPGGEAP